MTTTGKRCKEKNRRGEPCGAYVVRGSEYCYWHDPTKAKERAVARARGGYARHGRNVGRAGKPELVEIREMADVVTLLETTINDVLNLENSLQRARTIATLANVVIKALEFAALEARVCALEAVIKSEVRK